jgi:hypothetical protein
MLIEGEQELLLTFILTVCQFLACAIALQWVEFVVRRKVAASEKLSARSIAVALILVLLNVPTIIMMRDGTLPGYESLRIDYDFMLTAILSALTVFVYFSGPAWRNRRAIRADLTG